MVFRSEMKQKPKKDLINRNCQIQQFLFFSDKKRHGRRFERQNRSLQKAPANLQKHKSQLHGELIWREWGRDKKTLRNY